MKKYLAFLAISFVFVFTFLSCSDDIKDCEKKNTTHIEVVNASGSAITVKVWIENVGFTEEQQVVNGASYVFYNVSATSAELWIDMGTHWYWSDTYILTACEMFTFTWG
jgi:hypothetical protein